MAQTSIQIRIDEDLKKEFDYIVNELGMSVTTAFNIFAKAVVRNNGIPFELLLPSYNQETEKVIENTKKNIGLSKDYSDVKQMFEDILK